MAVDYSHIDQSLVALFSPSFKTQSDIKFALNPNVITARHPLVQPSKPTRTRNRRTVYHCNGIDVYHEKVSEQFSKWTFAFPADAQLLTGWLAMNYGSALAPTGTPADEVQTVLNAAAADNTYALRLTHRGRVGTTRLIAFNATAAQVKSALEAIDTIEPGDITSVTGTLQTGLVVTFGGKLAKADIPLLEVVTNTVTVGTFTVTETTKGANKLHNIGRSTSVEMALTSFIIGFEEEPILREHKGFACDAIIVDAQNREDLSCTVELIGRADTEEVLDVVIPECVTINPIEVNDCRLRVDGDYLIDDLFSFRFERRNNIPITGKGMFPWADKNVGILWRGPKPTELFQLGFYGSETHPLYAKADNENGTSNNAEIIADLGVAGNMASIIAPNVALHLAEPDLTFDNDLRRSVANIVGQPHYDGGIFSSSRVEGRIAQATAFLTT